MAANRIIDVSVPGVLPAPGVVSEGNNVVPLRRLINRGILADDPAPKTPEHEMHETVKSHDAVMRLRLAGLKRDERGLLARIATVNAALLRRQSRWVESDPLYRRLCAILSRIQGESREIACTLVRAN